MKRACVIGWPVEHSRSPLIHRYWLKQYGIDGAYEKEAVRPEELARFLGSLEAHGYAGANVTLPHKEAALRLAASRPTRRRAAIGAANTLWLDRAGTAPREQHRRLWLHDQSRGGGARTGIRGGGP